MPRLVLHALQVNIPGGRLPEPEANGTHEPRRTARWGSAS
jgi:hypothetical protein